MAFEFKAIRRVEFSETDMAGIVHYSNFFRYMETAEQGYFRLLGYSVVMNHSATPVGWPRVHAECDYSRPLRFVVSRRLGARYRPVRSWRPDFLWLSHPTTVATPTALRRRAGPERRAAIVG